MTDVLKLENQLCHRFYTVSNAFTRAYRPLLKGLDITYPQYVVLMALWEKDGITIQALLDSTHIDGGAMSLILKKLLGKEYLEIKVGEKDKRTRFVYLSKKGKEAESIAAEVPQQMLCKMDKINMEEMKQLISLIDKLSDNLQGVVCEAD